MIFSKGIKIVKRLITIAVFGIILPVFLCGEAPTDDKPAVAPDSIRFGRITIRCDPLLPSADIRQLQNSYARRLVNETTLNTLRQQIFSEPARLGYPFATLTMTAVSPAIQAGEVWLNPTFRLARGEQVRIDTVIFRGVEKTRPELLARSTAVFREKIHTSSMDTDMRRALRRYPFLQVDSRGEVIRTRSGEYGLLYSVTEEKDNRFGGIVGYVPETPTQKGYFTGEIDLEFQNLSGTGRQLHIYWSKMNRYSQQIRLVYFEPWIWRTPFFGRGRFEQILRDTLMVIRDGSISIGQYGKKGARLQLNMGYRTALPTRGGRNLYQLQSNRVYSLGVGFELDRRNREIAPNRGMYIQTEYNLGSRSAEKSARRLQLEWRQDLEIYLRLRPEIILFLGGHFYSKWIRGAQLNISDYYYFGGARNLRGYPNDFFSGRQIGWLNLELQQRMGRFSSVYLFFDQGYYHHDQTGFYPHAYGIGLRLSSRIGIIGLDYGFGEGDTFSTAKLHVRLQNRF